MKPMKPGTAVRLASHVRAAYYPGIDHETMLVVVRSAPDRRYIVATPDGREREYNAMAEDVVPVVAPVKRSRYVETEIVDGKEYAFSMPIRCY